MKDIFEAYRGLKANPCEREWSSFIALTRPLFMKRLAIHAPLIFKKDKNDALQNLYVRLLTAGFPRNTDFKGMRSFNAYIRLTCRRLQGAELERINRKKRKGKTISTEWLENSSLFQYEIEGYLNLTISVETIAHKIKKKTKTSELKRLILLVMIGKVPGSTGALGTVSEKRILNLKSLLKTEMINYLDDLTS